MVDSHEKQERGTGVRRFVMLEHVEVCLYRDLMISTKGGGVVERLAREARGAEMATGASRSNR